MEAETQKLKPNNLPKPPNKTKSPSQNSRSSQQIQNNNSNAQSSGSDDSQMSSGWSSQVIEPAIKTMTFRSRRGTRMKELMKGKHRKDQFWQKYQSYFGGDLDQPQDSDEEDYEASSSGRDQFDSDFDLTDSYVGKRGRKKGTRIRKRRPQHRREDQKQDQQHPNAGGKGRPGRKKKAIGFQGQQKSQTPLKVENRASSQRARYLPESRSDDVFLIVKKARKSARPRGKRVQHGGPRDAVVAPVGPVGPLGLDQGKDGLKFASLDPGFPKQVFAGFMDLELGPFD